MTDWDSLETRLKFLDSIRSNENKSRKAKSLQEYEIYNGNINQYVESYLTSQLSAKTVQKMPIISSIEICKRIVDQEASVYRQSPNREFTEISEEDKAVLDDVYSDAMADIKLLKSNRYFKLQSQSMIQIFPKDKHIEFRVLFPHNFDVIPHEDDPEKAESIVISAFNKEQYVTKQANTSLANNSSYVVGSQRDNFNQFSADQDDYKAKVERYVVWSNEFNFIMDGNGKILSKDTINPIGMLPFVDVASDKDYNYFIDRGSQLANFAIQYNAALSDLANIVRMQAYSQAVMIGPKEAMPENIVVGPTSIIKLAIDPNNPAQTDFKFVSPSPDLAGSIEFIEVLISNFLSARGLNSSTVSGKSSTEKFSSGLERFLSMIDRFEASKSDYSLYAWVEEQCFKIIKAWLLYYSGTDTLEKEYWVSGSIDQAELSINFVKPEAVSSDSEKLDVIQKKMDLGLIDDVTAMMELYNYDETEAIEKLSKIQERSFELRSGAPVVENTELKAI